MHNYFASPELSETGDGHQQLIFINLQWFPSVCRIKVFCNMPSIPFQLYFLPVQQAHFLLLQFLNLYHWSPGNAPQPQYLFLWKFFTFTLYGPDKMFPKLLLLLPTAIFCKHLLLFILVIKRTKIIIYILLISLELTCFELLKLRRKVFCFLNCFYT